MKNLSLKQFWFVILLSSLSFSSVGFSTAPSVIISDNSATVSFAVTSTIDVEVAVTDPDGKIVRHLAAGVVGGEFPPPSPLVQGLSQSISWDYNDDNGQHVPFSTTYKIRVRLGVKPVWQYFIDTKLLPGTKYGSSDIPTKSQSVIRMTHPLFGRIQLEQNPKLHLTVNDLTEKVYVRLTNTATSWKLAYHVFDGRTGQLTDTIFLNEGERHQHHISGEITFSWDGSAIYYSSGLDCIYRFSAQTERFTYWPVTRKAGVCDLPTEHGHTRGHAAGPDNNLYNIYEPIELSDLVFNNVYSKWQMGCVAKIDTTGTILNPSFIQIHAPMSGIRLDPAGNVFVGARVKPRGKLVPDYIDTIVSSVDTMWTDRWWAEEMYGSILKFGPNGGSLTKKPGLNEEDALEAGKDRDTLNIHRYSLAAEGLEWAYYGFSPALSHYGHIRATGDGGIDYPNPRLARLGSRCLCQVGRFDVDKFGRVFLPDPFKLSITAIDNNRNLMFTYGHKEMWNEYDSLIRRGGVRLMSWPHAIEATDEAVYVADQFNNQIVRFRLEADVTEELNVPISTEKMQQIPNASFLSNTPNPFNPVTNIVYYVPVENAEINLSIYNANGSKLGTLVTGTKPKGFHSVSWNLDNAGSASGSGLFICRYIINNKSFTTKMVVLK